MDILHAQGKVWTFTITIVQCLSLYNYNLPSLSGVTQRNRDCSHKAQADLLSAEHCLPCTWDQTSQSQFPSSSYRHGMSPQSLCCRKWNTTLIPVLGLIKELIKLHTFPKSCLELGRLTLSSPSRNVALFYITPNQQPQDERFLCPS